MFILLHIIALLLTSVCFAQTNTRFSGTFNYTSQSMTGGVVPGQFYYDWNAKSYKAIFNLPGHSYSETYLYGTSETSNGVNATQWLFATDNACCQPLTLASSNMPRLFPDPSYVSAGSDSINNVTCTHYTPAITPTVEYSVTDIWFDGNGNLCQVKFLSEDNGTYTFASISTTASFDDNTVFQAPQSCFCTAPLDIMFVVDLSGSITIQDWLYVRQFFHGFISDNNFVLEPNSTNIAVEIFSNFTTIKVPFSAGSSQSIADQTIDANMTCCNSGNPSGTSCCSYGWTSISLAIRNAADTLYQQHQARPYATPVMIVMTDGGHNTLWNATNPGGSCGYYQAPCNSYVVSDPIQGYIPTTNPAYLGNEWYYCINDKNNDSIPDSWFEPPQSTWLPISQGGITVTPNVAPIDLMARCYVDLISAREYALNQFSGNLPIFAIGVNGILPVLQLISNNLFKKPVNAPQQDLKNTWISWTPVYNTSDQTDLSRVMTPSSFSNLDAIQNLLTTSVCKQYSNTSCGNCCGFCTKCGICVPPPVCTTSKPCFTAVNPTSSAPCCSVEPLCPVVSLPCNISSCDTTTNTCSYFNPCTVVQNCTDTCVPPAGQCLVGNCVNHACQYNNTCPATGNACNQTYCADSQCLSHPVTCNSNDICKIDSCDPLLGCQHTDVICPPPNDTCSEAVCDTRFGCISQPIQCFLDSNGTVLRIYHNYTEIESTAVLAAGYCGYATCVGNGTCAVISHPCTTTIVGAALSAGIIAGIIIAIIACLLLSGGGVAAYAQYAKNDGLATVHQNPLFHPAGTGGENPLHGGG